MSNQREHRRPGWPAVALAALAALAGGAPAAALDAYPADAFHRSIGTNAKLSPGANEQVDTERYNATRDALADVGILNIRTRVLTSTVGRTRGLYDCCGIRALARIEEHTGGLPTPADPSKIPAAVAKTLSVGPAIQAMEGLNEYTRYNNTGSWDVDLRTYQQVLYNEVKVVHGLTEMPVVGPTVYARSAVHTAQIGNIGDIVDAANLHYYPGGWEPSKRLDEYVNLMATMAPGEPVWVTEYGYHTTSAAPQENPVPEWIQAVYMTRTAALLFQKDPRGKYFSYEFVNGGFDLANREHNFGMLNRDFTPKPAYLAYKRLIHAVRGGDPAVTPTPLDVTFTGDMLGVRTILLQKSPGHYVLLMWQEARVWDRKNRLEIAVPARPITITLGQAADMAVKHTLPFPADPAIDLPPEVITTGGTSGAVMVPDRIIAIAIDLI